MQEQYGYDGDTNRVSSSRNGITTFYLGQWEAANSPYNSAETTLPLAQTYQKLDKCIAYFVGK